MKNDEIIDRGTTFLIVIACILFLSLCGAILIDLRGRYIDLQLKERLLYSGDNSYIEELLKGE